MLIPEFQHQPIRFLCHLLQTATISRLSPNRTACLFRRYGAEIALVCGKISTALKLSRFRDYEELTKLRRTSPLRPHIWHWLALGQAHRYILSSASICHLLINRQDSCATSVPKSPDFPRQAPNQFPAPILAGLQRPNVLPSMLHWSYQSWLPNRSLGHCPRPSYLHCRARSRQTGPGNYRDNP